MKTDYKDVLIKIIQIFKKQGNFSPISTTSVAQQIRIGKNELLIFLDAFTREGYLRVEKPGEDSKVRLISPTVKGFETVELWEKQIYDSSFLGRITTFAKKFWGIALTTVMGLLLYWIGVSTSLIEPLRLSHPFYVHDQNALTEDTGSSYYALNVKLFDGEYPNPDGRVTATLDGWITLQFDAQSTAENYPIYINSIDVEIIRQYPPEVADVLALSRALGGGVIRKYAVPEHATENIDIGEKLIVNAPIVIDYSSKVDYVYLDPKQRETIWVRVHLDEPGAYTLTPIIHYGFGNKTGKYISTATKIVYPIKYKYWIEVWKDDNTFESFLIDTITLNTQSLDFQMQNVSTMNNRQACFPLQNWVAFITTLADFAEKRLFVLNLGTGELIMLSNANGYIGRMVWDNNKNLYFEETQGETTLIKSWNPITGIRDVTGDNILFPDESDFFVGAGYKAISPDKAQIAYKKGGSCNSGYSSAIFVGPNDNNLQQILYSPSDIKSLAWLPDNTTLAFASNRSLDISGNPTCDDESFQIYTINTATGSETKITQGKYHDTIWGFSPDNEWLILSGNDLAMVKLDGTCYQQLFPGFLEYTPRGDDFSKVLMQP